MCLWWRCVRLRLKTLSWGDLCWADPGAWISQYWCWGDSWWGDSKSDLNFMHWWFTVHALVNVYSQLNTETVVAHVIYVQTICEEPSGWSSLILYMHHVTLGWCHTRIKLVGFVDFIDSYHAYFMFKVAVGVMLFRSNMRVSGILRSYRWWHCLWHWTPTWVVLLTKSVQVRWCTTKTITADQWSQGWLKADVHNSGVMWSRPFPLRMLLIS